MKREDLNKLYQNGLISSKPFHYLELKSKVSQYLSQGFTKTESVKKTSKIAKVSEQTVWTSLKATNGINIT